jgi:hypothetical protein
VGDYSLDQTLARLSNRLEELEEHQRLSRFDTVMFLTYPLITLVMTALANASVQTNPVLQQMRFFGIWTAKDVFNAVYSPSLVFVVAGFLYFVRSYLTDDLRGRMWSVFSVAVGSSFMAFELLMSPIPWPLFGNEVTEAPQSLAAFVALVRIVYGLISGFGVLIAGILVAYWICWKFSIWLDRNARKMTVAAGLEPHLVWDSSLTRFAKRAWVALFLPSYAVAVMLSIEVSVWSVGHVGGTILYHYWALVALVVLTILYMTYTHTHAGT